MQARYVLERQDQEDGSIHYEIWAVDSLHRLCTICEDPVDDVEFDDETPPDRGRAKEDAELILRALNALEAA